MGIQRADLALLHGSMNDLSRTLMAGRSQREGKRQFDVATNQRGEENRLDRAMREEEFGLRREDAADARSIGREGLDVQKQNQASLEDYKRQMLAAKSDDQKMQIFSDMLKSGTMTPQSLDAMSKAMSEKLGLQVSLKMPEKTGFNTQSSHNLKLAEEYRSKAAGAAPAEAKRFLAIADRLERSTGPKPEEDFGSMESAPDAYEQERTAEEDAMGATLKEGPGMLERALSQRGRGLLGIQPKAGGIPAHGAPSREGLQSAPPALQAPGLASGEPAFDTEEQARSAGHKAGDIVRLLIEGKPRRVRLK